MESIGSSVANVDRHLDAIEYSLGRMQRHSRRPITPFNLITSRNNPTEKARQSSHSQPWTRKASSRDLDRQLSSAHHTGTSVEANVGRSQPQTSKSVSVRKGKPLDLRSWKGGSSSSSSSSSNVGIAPSAAMPAQLPQCISRKSRKGESSDKKTLGGTYRFKKSPKQRKSMPLHHSFTSLLSSSSSTLFQDSSPSSRTSSCFSHSPSASEKLCPLLVSTVSTALTSASIASFSSIENSTAGELATRWLQWRKASYDLLASHYEKCHGLFLITRKRGHRGAYTINALDTSNEERHQQREAGQPNDSREYLTTPSESIASLDSISEDEDTFEVYNNSNIIKTKQHPHNTPSNVSSQRNNTVQQHQKQYIQQPGTPSEMRREVIAAVEREAAKRNLETRQRLVDREDAERDALEQDEDDCFTHLLELMGKEAIVVAQREAAKRNLETRQRLVDREEAERDALEQDEDECFTHLLELMGEHVIAAVKREAARVAAEFAALLDAESAERHTIEAEVLRAATALERDLQRSSRSAINRERRRLAAEATSRARAQCESETIAASESSRQQSVMEEHQKQYIQQPETPPKLVREDLAAVEREAAKRNLETRQRLVDREDAERDALEQDEDECFTHLLELMGKEAIVVARREAAKRNLETRQRLVDREEAKRDALEQDEDDCFTHLLELMGKEAIVVARREAAKRNLETRQRLVDREEAKRDALEQDEDKCFTRLLELMGEHVIAAVKREAARVAAEFAALLDAESAERHTIEAEVLRAATALERDLQRSSRSAINRERRRLAAEATSRARAQCESETIAASESSRQQSVMEEHQKQYMQQPETPPKLVREDLAALDPVYYWSDKLNTVADICMKLDGVAQTPEHRSGVRSAQTEAAYFGSSTIASPVAITTAAAPPNNTAEQWKQLYLLSETIQTNFPGLSTTVVAVQTDIKEEENTAPRIGVPVRSSRTSQTLMALHVAVQTSDEMAQNANCEGTHGVPTIPAFTSENNNKANLLAELDYCIFPEDGNSEFQQKRMHHQVEEEYHKSNVVVSSSSSSVRPLSSHGRKAGTTGMKAKKEVCVTTAHHGLELLTDEQDSPNVVVPIEQDTSPGVGDAKSMHKGRSSKRRGGSNSSGGGADGIPLAADSTTAPGAYSDETQWHMRDSLSFDEDRQAASSQWGFDVFDTGLYGDDYLQAAVFRELLRVEIRHRRHVERHEVMERNELRWEELTHFRVLVRNIASAAIPTSSSSHIPAAIPADAECVVAHVDSAEPNTACTADDALRWSAADEKENITPRTEIPRPFATTERKSSTAWCVDMIDGPCGTPPHLRHRPWAPMLTRRASWIRDDKNHNNYNNSGGTKTPSLVGSITKKKGKKGKVVSFSRSPGTLPYSTESEEELLLETYEYHPHDMTLYQTPESVPAKRSTKSTPGYAQQYKQRLMRQQSADGVYAKDPLYCRVTTCFLESAEWRYQKMYVDQQLYRSPYVERRSGSARKCADVICEEVGRAHSSW
ncbi:uncharacterized protein TM35_000292220 [Trypanosoma theileri]|uniref:Uncharacterized protein n=1 Tax=Trypanosoma theileri TaxID=67003 RepID=A0A1X0NQC9_9TRYP|nr:uncharacterized protein TM35_000292220 [Trypanosoma theileri]ORC86340.1 hypothetical protein TM35_000292220 [Trypanosoma theileri]